MLKLSTMWSMDKVCAVLLRVTQKLKPAQVRTQAISELFDLTENDPVERVRLARTFRIPGWLLDGFDDLATGWDVNDWSLEYLANGLGWETAARILELAVKAKSPSAKPGQEKVTLHFHYCKLCDMSTSVNVMNPVSRVYKVKCRYCPNILLDLVPRPLENPSKKPVYLEGDALREAVKDAFADELALIG